MVPPVLIMIVTVVISFTAYMDILSLEEEKCWDTLEDTASVINNEIAVRFKDNITILKLAANAMVQENRVESYEAIGKHINAFQSMTIFDRIDVVYPDNTVLLQSGERIDLSGDYTFAKAAERGEHMSQRIVDIVSGRETVYYTVPVVSNGKTLALLTGVIECINMPELFKTRAYDGKAFGCVVDYRDGSFIMDDWHDKLGNIYEMKPRNQLKGYEDVDLIADVKEAKTGVTAYTSAQNGKSSYMYYTPVGIFDWELLIVVQEQVAFASLIKLKATFITIGIVEAILLLLYFIWTLSTVNQLEKSNREIEEKQSALELLSYSDTLTKLYNRNKYNEKVEEYRNNCPKNLGAGFFDLNGLKRVNDEQGHKVGDVLIQKAAGLVDSAFPDAAFRIGGDEFVILVPNMDKQEFTDKVQQLKAALAESNVNMSVGVAWKEKDYDIAALLKAADEQMYKEKRKYYGENSGDNDRRGKRCI